MNGATAGVKLGNAIAQLATRVREDSLGKTTPALVQAAAQVADQVAAAKAEKGRQELVRWFESKGVHVPPDGELQGLLGALARAGGWLMQNTLSTAIGFGIGSAMAAVLEPFFLDMAQAAWRTNPARTLTPEQASALVARGWITDELASSEALAAGVTPERLAFLRRLSEVELGVTEILELWRRGDIDEREVERRFERAGVAPDTARILRALRFLLHTPDEALLAQLQGQVPEAEARRLYEEAGGRPEDFEWRFNNRGTAPSPVQAIDLLNRGIIGERGKGPTATTYEQAFLEGPWRNKWLEPFLALREYIVPPRSVVPIVRSGAWTAERGAQELARSGVPADAAEAMLSEASAQKVAPERDLAKTEITRAYTDGLLQRDAAARALEDLGYDRDEVDLLIGLAEFADARRLRDARVNRIGTLYRARKIDDAEAQGALASLGVEGEALSKYMALWDVERELPTADLTEAQVRAAWRAAVVDEAYYTRWLTDHGYSSDEARILAETYRPTEGGR